MRYDGSVSACVSICYLRFSILQVSDKYLHSFWMCFFFLFSFVDVVFFFFQNNFREMGNFMRQKNITSPKFEKPIWIYRLLLNIICRKKNLNAFCFRSVVLFRVFFFFDIVAKRVWQKQRRKKEMPAFRFFCRYSTTQAIHYRFPFTI